MPSMTVASSSIGWSPGKTTRSVTVASARASDAFSIGSTTIVPPPCSGAAASHRATSHAASVGSIGTIAAVVGSVPGLTVRLVQYWVASSRTREAANRSWSTLRPP